MQNISKTRQIAMTGVMAALVFAGSKLEIPLIAESRIHLGNVICLLSAYILGPVYGGLAAGIGSAAFDLTDPRYVSSMGFTLIFKFAMAFVCGKIAWAKGNEANNNKRNFVAGAMGIVAYLMLYIPRNIIRDYFFKNLAGELVVISAVQRLLMSSINGVIAVLIAVPLAKAIKTALDRS